jgi:predicted RNA methylase
MTINANISTLPLKNQTSYKNTQREQCNLEALSALKQGNASPELLKNYTGWGGLKNAIYDRNVYAKLKTILADDEIVSLKNTLTSGYYTPKYLIKFIYAGLERLGFKSGDILEPALGTGRFVEHMPTQMRQASNISCIEIDTISSKIAKTLYPELDIKTCGFEAYNSNKKFDLIIGNPPFGKDCLNDTQHPDLSKLVIHHYFAAKAIKLLKDNGILAMILPSFFMDNVRDHARKIIKNLGGYLITAFRLPDNLFADAKITVDIVFLGKQPTSHAWINTKIIAFEEYNKPINEYYINHPENILGELKVVDMYERKGIACKRTEGFKEFLVAACKAIPKNYLQSHHQSKTNSKDTIVGRVEKLVVLLQKKKSEYETARKTYTRIGNEIENILAQLC